MARPWIIAAGLLGALGVAMGAFGSHAPSSVLPNLVRTIYETAVRYHLVHSLALLGTGVLLAQFPGRAARLRAAAGLFVAGLVLFSGSLYVIALAGWEWPRWLTPLGGLSWIAAWLALAWAFLGPEATPRRRARRFFRR